MKKLLFLLPFLLLAGCGQESQCQELVKDQLKAPSTAIFTKMETYNTDTYGKVVGGFVESQNGFGAMVGDKFYCVNIGDEKLVIFREDETDRYDELTDIIKGDESNNEGKAECEEATQKILNDKSIKFVRYIGDEEGGNLRLNGGIFEKDGEIKNVMCYVDDKKGGLYQVKIDDKVYKLSHQTEEFDKPTEKQIKEDKPNEIDGFNIIPELN